MDLRITLLLLSDAVMAVAALYLAPLIRFGRAALPEEWQVDHGVRVCLIFVVANIFSSYLMEVYSLPRASRKREVLITCLQAAGAAFFILSVVYYLDPDLMLGRGILFIALALFILFQFVWRVVSDSAARTARFEHRVMILGTGDLACQLGGLLTSHRGEYALAGYLDCNEETRGPVQTVHQPELFRSQIIEREGDLLQTARKLRVGMIVVALTERRGTLPLQEMMRCKLNGVEVVDAPTFYELVQGKLMLEQMTPSWIIFSSGFHRTTLIDVYKRSFDLILSLVGIAISAPLLPLIALAIKLDSPGPVFFKQVRVGSGEKTFLLYKFRSMCTDAERNGAVWAAKNDARVTRVGRFIRSTRLDELPQLYNVLKGDMSFIGPRPERPEFVETLKKDIYYYSKRHTIKPGLTGWAQVRYPYGATVEDAVEKLRYDLYYIKNLSFLLDWQILFETVKVVLFGRGVR